MKRAIGTFLVLLGANIKDEGLVMKLLSKDELEKLTTKRLIAYKNKLMMATETPNWDEQNARVNKTMQEWQDTYSAVKEILSTREHVERKSGK